MRFLPCLVLVLAVGCGPRSATTPNPQGTDTAPTPGSPDTKPSGPEGKTFTNDFKMEFVRVPKGGEIPQDFYLGVYEVTQEQWQAIMGNNPSAHSATGGNASKVQKIPP